MHIKAHVLSVFASRHLKPKHSCQRLHSRHVRARNSHPLKNRHFDDKDFLNQKPVLKLSLRMVNQSRMSPHFTNSNVHNSRLNWEYKIKIWSPKVIYTMYKCLPQRSQQCSEVFCQLPVLTLHTAEQCSEQNATNDNGPFMSSKNLCFLQLLFFL